MGSMEGRKEREPIKLPRSVLHNVRVHVSIHTRLPGLKERLAQRVRNGRISQESADRLLKSFNRTHWASEPTADEIDAAAFVQRLLSRQATELPDFEAMYARTVELDRLLNDPELP